MNTMPAEYNPSLFVLSAPRKSYLSDSNQIVLNKLITGLKSDKKLFLISGPKKCGKTTLLQRAISELEKKPLVINIDPTPPFTYENLLDCVGNNIKDSFSSKTVLNRQSANSIDIKSAILKELIQEESISHILFIVNQSHKIQSAVLEKTLKLLNSTTFSSCMSKLIVTGLIGLETKIAESNISDAFTAGMIPLQVEPLSENDIRTYINVHLQGLREQGKNLFSNAAIERIIYYSKGLPGLINSLCNQGLLTAIIGEKSTITGEVMDEVLENSLFLGNDFDYTAPESQPLDSFSFDQSAPLATPIKNDNMNQRYIDDDVIKQDVTPPTRQKKRLKAVDRRSHKRHSLTKSQTPVNRSPKSIFIFAFIMGIIVTALANYGWDFFTKTDDKQESNVDIYTNIDLPEQPTQKTVTSDEEGTLSSIDKPLATNSTPTTDASNIESTELDKTEQITQVLLGHAEQQLQEKRLISPAQNNAWATYRKILEINPNNQTALSGVNTIKETYVNWAKYEIEKGNKAQAADYLNKALKVSPEDPQILDALSSLNNKSPTTANSTDNTKYQSEPSLDNDLYKYLDKPDGIANLLTLAQVRVSEKNLTTPENNNALGIYKLILSRDSEHKEALAGIKNIKNKYLLWAKHEIKQGNFRHAEYLYSKALEVSPSDPEALSDLQQLKNTTGNQ